ncbi:hypothetical protein BC629DRAFT_380137 [Irpex lacteus]|nr:hypothetical protein BC629DRAFT_380137 [Irpex lacteus]
MHAAAGIKLTGQILSLRPLTPQPTTSSSPSNNSLVKSQPAATAKGSRKTIEIKIVSHVCSVVNAQVINMRDYLAEMESSTCETDFSHLNSAGLTWGFPESETDALVIQLWGIINTQKLLAVVPVFRTNSDVPYRLQDASSHLFLPKDPSSSRTQQAIQMSTVSVAINVARN